MGASVRWAFNLANWQPSEPEMLLATSCLQPEEKERIGRFVFKRDFKASLIGRLLMRKYVNEATGIPYERLSFGRDDHGKPVLCNKATPSVNFNVSHHGNYSVLAGEVGGGKLGVDVMKLEYTGGKDLSEFFRVMHRQFSLEEWGEIKRGSSERSQIESFCRHWALKESYCKALGTGIYTDLQEYSFKVNTRTLSETYFTRDTEVFVKSERQDWLFEEVLLDKEHCVAVALQDCESHGETFEVIDFAELTKGAVPLIAADSEYCQNYFRKEEKPN